MEEVLKGTIKDLIVKQLMTYLVSKLPFLAFPIINPLASFLLSKLVTVIIEKTILGANFLAIDYSIDRDLEEMQDAVKEAKKAVQSNDEKAIEESSQKLIEASRDLIRIGRGLNGLPNRSAKP